MHKDKTFANKVKHLFFYHTNKKVLGKKLSAFFSLDTVDGKHKPFFNGVATMEDLGLHLRLKID